VDLLLWRHAEAEVGEADHSRTLTAKGHKQAARVGEWIERNLPSSCRILVSPAERTQQTAAALGRKFKTLPSLAPEFAVADLLAAAEWPTCRESVLIVGHQPTLGSAASLLLAGRDMGWSVRKGAVWWLTSRTREGDSQTVLRAVMSPDLL
jgi:phosphohistidine phosphatase